MTCMLRLALRWRQTFSGERRGAQQRRNKCRREGRGDERGARCKLSTRKCSLREATGLQFRSHVDTWTTKSGGGATQSGSRQGSTIQNTTSYIIQYNTI
eukprot:2074669-Prymnesium_polylepis.1